MTMISGLTNNLNHNHQNNTAMRKLLVFSDNYTVRLLKSYVEPYNFTVKQILQPSSLMMHF